MRFRFIVFLYVFANLCSAASAKEEVYAAWTQVTGSAASNADVSGFVDLNLSLRIIIETTDPNATCPDYAALTAAGTVEALSFEKRVNSPGHMQFPVIICQADAPDAASFALLTRADATADAVVFSGTNQRVVLSGAARVGASGPPTFVAFGDTGCRGLQNHRGRQECRTDHQGSTSLTKFVFADLAKQAAKLGPDFVVHLGDYRYNREFERTMDRWDSDFFERVRLGLLADVPWVFVRGNHEDCSLAGRGWFYFFAPDQGTCDGEGMSKTFHFDVADRSAGGKDPHRFVVIDTSASYGSQRDRQQAANADMQLAVRATESMTWPNNAAPSAWFLMHKPLWAVDDYPNPPEQADHFTGSLLRSVMNNHGSADCTSYDYKKCGLKAVLAAHLHILQNAVAVGGALPQQIVVGNSGVRMDHAVVPVGCAFSVNSLGFGAQNATVRLVNVRGRVTHVDNSAFGFAHFKRDPDVQPSGWAGNAYYIGDSMPDPLGSLKDTQSNTNLPCQHN